MKSHYPSRLPVDHGDFAGYQAAPIVRAAWLEVEQMQGSNWIKESLGRVAVARMRGAYRDEIERAINNIKRTDIDRWFRREWYRAAAYTRRWSR